MELNNKLKINKNWESILLLDKNNNQLYYHFNDLLSNKKLDLLENIIFFGKEIEIIVRWFDYYKIKKFKRSMSIKTVLKKSIRLIEEKINENNDLFKSLLNQSGLYLILKYKNKLYIEAQFS